MNLTLPFNGVGDVEEFIQSFKGFALAANCQEEKHANVLRLYLRESAYDCWNKLAADKKKSPKAIYAVFISFFYFYIS
jgi:hypothetical protein